MMIRSLFSMCILIHLAESYNCNDTIYTLLKETIQCQKEPIQNLTNEINQSCDCYINQEDIHIDVLNNTTGNISVEFKLCKHPCKHNYKVVMLIDESIRDEKTCNNHSPILEKSSVHSFKILNTNLNDDVLSCKKRTTLIFPYVYTGCYSIIIYREGNCDKPLGSTLQKYIATDYNKTLHINVMPFIHIDWSAYEKQLSYYIWNITKQNLIKISTFLQSCGNNSNPDISTLCLNEIACDIQLYSNGTSNIHCRDGRRNTTTECQTEDKVIKCKVNATNLPIDVFYRVTVAFSTDSSCKPILNEYDQVWKRSTCTYSSHTSYADKFKVKPLDTVPSRSNMIPIAWGLSVAVVAIIFLCVSFICYLRRVPIDNMSVHLPGINNEYQPKEHMSKILLLYPRDCVKFMEAMVALRNVLKHSTKCEVVDLYDKELEETISKNKTDWLQNIMQNTDVKIVLIETECAVLHQKALLGNFLIDYADYHWLNDLFMYALKILKDDLTSNEYERIFVLEIEGFKNQNDSLSYVTPRRRYMIPQYTKELLKHICLPNNMNNSCNESTEKSELINNDDDADNDDIDVMKKLEECVKELQCNKITGCALVRVTMCRYIFSWISASVPVPTQHHEENEGLQ